RQFRFCLFPFCLRFSSGWSATSSSRDSRPSPRTETTSTATRARTLFTLGTIEPGVAQRVTPGWARLCPGLGKAVPRRAASPASVLARVVGKAARARPRPVVARALLWTRSTRIPSDRKLVLVPTFSHRLATLAYPRRPLVRRVDFLPLCRPDDEPRRVWRGVR